MERIYIGMGSNLAAPAQQLRSAVEALARLPGTTVAGVSAFIKVTPCSQANRAIPMRLLP